jgi:uncharacterized protein UPF0158
MIFDGQRLTHRQSWSCNLYQSVFKTGGRPSAAMTTSAVLDDLIDALEMQSDSIFSYLDRETGEVFLISEESLSLSEAEPERLAMLPDWQKQEAELVIGIQTTDRYLELPNRFDVNEWNIMHEFCLQIKKVSIRNNLLHAIHGNHPFRRFKDQIANHDLWEEWNRFRRRALVEILRDWSEENSVILTVRQEQPAPK